MSVSRTTFPSTSGVKQSDNLSPVLVSTTVGALSVKTKLAHYHLSRYQAIRLTPGVGLSTRVESPTFSFNATTSTLGKHKAHRSLCLQLGVCHGTSESASCSVEQHTDEHPLCGEGQGTRLAAIACGLSSVHSPLN
jgi:hypothetical protein